MFYHLHIKIIEFTGHLSQNSLSRRGIWTFQTGSEVNPRLANLVYAWRITRADLPLDRNSREAQSGA